MGKHSTRGPVRDPREKARRKGKEKGSKGTMGKEQRAKGKGKDLKEDVLIVEVHITEAIARKPQGKAREKEA